MKGCNMADSTPDLNVHREQYDLTSSDGDVFGVADIEYRILRRRFVHDLQSKTGYEITMRNRVLLFGGHQAKDVAGYVDYPVSLGCTTTPKLSNNQGSLRLITMSPKTLRAAISETLSSQEGKAATASHTATSGESWSNVNSVNVGASGGMIGPVPYGGVNAGYSHTWEHTTSTSTSKETGTENSRNNGAEFGISINDWSAYSSISPKAKASPTWVWGQTYPWDVLSFHKISAVNAGGFPVVELPDFVRARLFSGKTPLPPSAPSLYGSEFTMSATWIVEYADEVADEVISFTHQYTSQKAYNVTTGDAPLVMFGKELAKFSATSPEMNLSHTALSPIVGRGLSNGATIASLTPFTIAPQKANFQKISAANTLLLEGKGFNERMQAGPSNKESTVVNFDIFFKILDVDQEYTLSFAHWIDTDQKGPCVLEVTVNDHTPLILFVTGEKDAASGRNVQTITLRDLDYASSDARDLLQVGLNKINVAVYNPETRDEPNIRYTLQAVSVD
jgi:hypothetical protein